MATIEELNNQYNTMNSQYNDLSSKYSDLSNQFSSFQTSNPTTGAVGLSATGTSVPTQGLVATQMNQLLDKNNDYMKRAATAGKQYSNSRGLLNSTMGAQAGQAAAIDAALPIATQDAQTYAQYGLQDKEFAQQSALDKDKFAQERAIELWKQENVAFAQLLKGMSDVQAADIAAADKKTGVDQLWNTYKASRPMSSSLRDITIENGQIVAL